MTTPGAVADTARGGGVRGLMATKYARITVNSPATPGSLSRGGSGRRGSASASTYAIPRGPAGQALVAKNDLWVKSSRVMAETDTAVLSTALQRSDGSGSPRRKSKRFQDSSRARVPKNARCIIDPKSTYQGRWDIVMMVLLVYTATVTPFEVGFLDIADLLHPLNIVNRVVDVLFLQDLFQQFMSPFYHAESGGWVIHHGRIARNYLTGWFVIDFVSILPFSLLGRLMDSEDLEQLKILRVIRLLRLAKLLRIFRSSRIVKRYQSHIGISHATQTMIKFGVMIVTIAHWLACLWGVVTTVDNTMKYGNQVNWMRDYGMWEEIQGKPGRLYMSALYWATMTVTTIGYGDIRPTNESEQILCVLAMLVGASTYAYVIGNVCGVIALMDQATSKYNQQMDELNLYMAENHMPNKLRVRLREYFQYSKQLNRQRYYQALLLEMSPALRGEVANYINAAWLENIAFFNPPLLPDIEREQFCTDISLRLEPEAYAPQETVVRVGEPTEKFYLLQRGVMASRGRIIGTGAYVGDDFVLHKQRRDYSVRAITYVDVFSLSKKALERVLNQSTLPTIAPRVRLYAIQLAFRKALAAHSHGSFQPHTSGLARTATGRRGMFNKWRRGSRSQAQEHGGKGRAEHGGGGGNGGVVADAEREIEMSKSVQNQRQVRCNESPSPQQKPYRRSPGPLSPPAVSPGGTTKRRISASAVGSASKVLQLMSERHDDMQTRTQEIRNTVAVAHNTMLDKMEALSKGMLDKHSEFKKIALGMSVGFVVLFGMCLAMLIQVYSKI